MLRRQISAVHFEGQQDVSISGFRDWQTASEMDFARRLGIVFNFALIDPLKDHLDRIIPQPGLFQNSSSELRSIPRCLQGAFYTAFYLELPACGVNFEWWATLKINLASATYIFLPCWKYEEKHGNEKDDQAQEIQRRGADNQSALHPFYKCFFKKT